jgi:hypothetical protein
VIPGRQDYAQSFKEVAIHETAMHAGSSSTSKAIMNRSPVLPEAGFSALTLGMAASIGSMGSHAKTAVMHQASTTVSSLAPRLEVGDVLFIRIAFKPFCEVAAATGTWTNHVGIVVEAGTDPVVAESRFPLSCRTRLSKFVARSEASRIAVARPARQLSTQEKHAVRAAAERRVGVVYDTGFDLHSRRQFCSRYVREVLHEASGVAIGDVETLSQLFVRQPNANLAFWRLWYFGNIPWNRETVTPASLLHSPALAPIFDGFVAR